MVRNAPPPSGTLTTLHSFDGTDGANPGAGLIQATDPTGPLVGLKLLMKGVTAKVPELVAVPPCPFGKAA